MSQPNYQTQSTPMPELTFSANAFGLSSPTPTVTERADDLTQRLHSAVVNSQSFESFCQSLARIVVAETDCIALSLATANESGPFTLQHLTAESAAIWELESESHQKLISSAAKKQMTMSAEVTNPARHQVIAVPIVFGPQTEFVLCSCCSLKAQSSDRQRWLMVIAGQALNQWCQQHQLARNSAVANRLNEHLQLAMSMSKCKTRRDGYFTVVNQLRSMLAANQVALCIKDKQLIRLVAISDVEQVDTTSENSREVLSACEPACRLEKQLEFTTETTPESETEPLQAYCTDNGWSYSVNYPLQDSSNQTIGSLLLAWKEDCQGRDELSKSLMHICPLIADQLGSLDKANRRLAEIAISGLRDAVKKRAVQIAVACGLALAVALCIPMPYRINCETQLQPIKRRFVAAPYDGILDKPLVEQGDIVARNQVLATMDGRALRMELAGLKAALKGAKKRSESLRVTGEIAQSQIAMSEMKRIASEIEILRQRSENLEIRSPIDGIIISGDLDKAEGVPLELGQTLFEVGPLDTMLAEVGIPESQIQYAQPGMTVSLKLEAIPFETFTGTVSRIHPRASIVNDKSVFLAEVELDNSSGTLRPGLNGQARINSHSHPLGWNLFHGAWESVRHWLVW